MMVSSIVDDASRERLTALVREVLAEAKQQGATTAEVGVNISQGLSVSVRLGEVETVEHTRDKGLGLTVYFGQRTGSASTTDFGREALRDTVRAACAIARHTAEDDCSGLADPDRLAREIPDLDLHHPWNPGVDKAIVLARECEAAARGVDKRITNSEGASLSTHEGLEVYGNTHGFLGAVAGSRHSLSVSVIAQDDAGMQRDYWYTAARDARALDAPAMVGRLAANRTLKRLNARRLSTRQCPVLYEAPIAGSLLSHFVGAIRGGALYRQASFLLDSLGKKIFTDFVRIHEQPHLKGALGSAAFDGEGVATVPRDLVRDGVLLGYVLDSYSARKLKVPTTGNAGGVHNLTITPGSDDSRDGGGRAASGTAADDLAALLKRMGTGLFVTELIGFGVNTVTGDYSRGAAGFWVENGEIQYPVEEITIAGNLREMFLHLAAVGSDVDRRGNIRTGSILIENMTVAGS
ncbi:MAG: metalloprotease PmbA [Pseudomonadota bacterium]